jgi:DNA-binding response OmpR family regulator
MEPKPVILYVEDETLISINVTEVLIDAGFDVDHAIDGPEALAKLDRADQQYVALITDIRLPKGIDGWNIAHHARELFPLIPVVYVSGDSAGDWTANGVPKSMMIQKPFANAQLVTAVTTLINDANLDSMAGDGR